MINGITGIRLLTLLLFVLILFTNVSAQTKKSSFTLHLDSLRKADNLEEWLIVSIEHLENNPAERISFLYTAEATAWRRPANNNERIAWFDLLTNQGYYELYRGNILRSIEAYEKAYRYYFDDPIPGAEADVLEYVLKPLGNNYTRLGDYERALSIHEKSLSLALNQKNAQQTAAAYNNLAICARWKSELDPANNYCLQGLRVVKHGSSLHGLLLSTLADIYFLSNKLPEASQHIYSAIGILKQNMNTKDADAAYWLMSAYQIEGNILKANKSFNAALIAYNNANKISNENFKGQRYREKAKLEVLAGDVLLQLQQPQQAMVKFNNALAILVPSWKGENGEALPSADDLYAENTLMDALHGKAECLAHAGKTEQALECFLLLFSVERKLRYEFFSRSAKQQQQKENRAWAESAIEIAYQLWKTNNKKEYAGKVLMIAELSKAQLLLDEMQMNLHYNSISTNDTLLAKQKQLLQAINFYERETRLNATRNDATTGARKELQYQLSLLQQQVRKKYPALQGYINEPLVLADSLLNNIPPRTRVMEFFAGKKAFYIIDAEKGKVNHITKVDGAAQVQQIIRDFVSGYFQQGPERMMNHPEQYYKDAYNIYRLLFNGSIVTNHERLIVVPDGITGYIPFDALVTDPTYNINIGKWPFLVKQVNLFSSYSLQTFHQQQRNNYDHTGFAGFFISFDSSIHASIPAVKKEYAALQKIVRGDFFLEKDASLQAFHDRLDETNLLHISTHAFLQDKDNVPVLQLSDGKFFLFELYGRTVHPQLVVLSACRTGHGMLAEGEGIVSLARGFTASGAGGIVASLWNLNDESTAMLMQDFYSRLTRGTTPANALFAVKKQWLERGHEQSFRKLPYFWAGLIYSGNDRPVTIAKRSGTMTALKIAGVALVMLALAYVIIRHPSPLKFN